MIRTCLLCMLMFLSLLQWQQIHAQPSSAEYLYADAQKILSFDQGMEVFVDSSIQMSVEDVVRQNFAPTGPGTPNLGISNATTWVRFKIEHQADFEQKLLLLIEQPTLELISLYTVDDAQIDSVLTLGELYPFDVRPYRVPNYIFDLYIQKGDNKWIYLKMRSNDQIQVPIYLGQGKVIMERQSYNNLFFGLYFGIMLIMIIYNFFVYLTVRDASYLYYIFFILFVALSQAMIKGYSFQYLYPNSPLMASWASLWIPVISGISTGLFVKKFLQVRSFNKWLDIGVNIFMGTYVVGFLVGALVNIPAGVQVIQGCAMFGSLYVLYVAIFIVRKGYRPAIFFLTAYSLFLCGVVIFVLRNFNVVPYTFLTANILEISSAIQVTLLSFALADKINTYRKENEESQARALRISQENELLIREQNIILERRVEERTNELLTLNDHLQSTLSDLKEAQSQLVESEKMASLGQLTAGIAHEINNPINFVTANVTPLRRDFGIMKETLGFIEEISLQEDLTAEQKRQKIEEYKEEIDYDYLNTEIEFLLKGMYEGASRTAEIVKSLRIFSRVDEDSSKYADINEGLESTLVILNSVLKDSVEVVKEYGDIPTIECYPGKLNQAFLNIISNSLYAIQAKFGSQPGGRLTIKTVLEEDRLAIHIADNGTGMPEHIKKKIFEPFFTTKEVGEGTGLGMSIVYNTMKKHNGEIEVETQEGEGTLFVLKVPLKQA